MGANRVALFGARSDAGRDCASFPMPRLELLLLGKADAVKKAVSNIQVSFPPAFELLHRIVDYVILVLGSLEHVVVFKSG